MGGCSWRLGGGVPRSVLRSVLRSVRMALWEAARVLSVSRAMRWSADDAWVYGPVAGAEGLGGGALGFLFALADDAGEAHARYFA
jgi:hypothetical protein